jgi:hypothetical protein
VQRVAGGALTVGEPKRALELMSAAAARTGPHDPVRIVEILAEAIAPAVMQGAAHDLAEQVECICERSPKAASVATDATGGSHD